MGRHSAPDDEDDVAVDAAGPTDVLVEEAPRRGRHSAAEPETAQPGTAEAETAATPRTEPQAATVPVRAGRATNADLRLLRQNPALRARCAAAVVVPFLLYTVVLLVVGATSSYLLWLWIPTVTAGVVAGGFLDRAARAAQKDPVGETPDPGPATSG